MLSVREKYWRYSLFVLIAGLGLTIFAELTPFLGGLLGAVTIYVLLRRQMWFLSERRRWRRSLAASLLLGEAIFFFLVPISLIVWMVVDKIQGVALDPQSVITPVRHVAGLIQQKTGYDLWSESNLQSVLGYLPRAGQWLVGGIVNFAVNLVVLLFVLYFMLIGGLRMETYCREILPFDRCAARSVMREIHMIVRSNAIVIPLLAVSQGVVAYVGYLAFGVPRAAFLGRADLLRHDSAHRRHGPRVAAAGGLHEPRRQLGAGRRAGDVRARWSSRRWTTSCGWSCRRRWPTCTRSSPFSGSSSVCRSSALWASSSGR